MNFQENLYQFLKRNNRVSVESFGTFYLQKSNAIVETTTNRILPPGKVVAFDHNSDSADDAFAEFLATQNSTTVETAKDEIKKQITYWNSILEKDGQLTLDNIGTFTLSDSSLLFNGNRFENLSPDFYGLEEINISDIKSSKRITSGNSSYRFAKTVYWLLPLLLIGAAIGYLAATQPELLFGEKTFKNEIAPEKKVESIKTKPVTQSNIIKDSLETDSTAIKPTVKTWKK